MDMRGNVYSLSEHHHLLHFFNHHLFFTILLRQPQKFTGNIGVQKTQHLSVFSSESKEIHISIPDYAFVNNSVSLLQFLMSEHLYSRLPQEQERFLNLRMQAGSTGTMRERTKFVSMTMWMFMFRYWSECIISG